MDTSNIEALLKQKADLNEQKNKRLMTFLRLLDTWTPQPTSLSALGATWSFGGRSASVTLSEYSHTVFVNMMKTHFINDGKDKIEEQISLSGSSNEACELIMRKLNEFFLEWSLETK